MPRGPQDAWWRSARVPAILRSRFRPARPSYTASKTSRCNRPPRYTTPRKRRQVVAMSKRSNPLAASLVLLTVALTATVTPAREHSTQATAEQSAKLPAAARIEAVRHYIKRTWTLLTRSVRDLPRAAPDPKMHRGAGEAWPVY